MHISIHQIFFFAPQLGHLVALFSIDAPQFLHVIRYFMLNFPPQPNSTIIIKLPKIFVNTLYIRSYKTTKAD